MNPGLFIKHTSYLHWPMREGWRFITTGSDNEVVQQPISEFTRQRPLCGINVKAPMESQEIGEPDGIPLGSTEKMPPED
jgi:hypothetical protein